MHCCASAELVGDVEQNSRGAGIAFGGVSPHGERGRNRERSETGSARHGNVVRIADRNPDGWLKPTFDVLACRKFFKQDRDLLK